MARRNAAKKYGETLRWRKDNKSKLRNSRIFKTNEWLFHNILGTMRIMKSIRYFLSISSQGRKNRETTSELTPIYPVQR